LDNDDYCWCEENQNHKEAAAYLAWCKTFGVLDEANSSIHIKRIIELMSDLYDDIWGDLLDLRERLRDE